MIELKEFSTKYDTNVKHVQSLSSNKYTNFDENNYHSNNIISSKVIIHNGMIVGAGLLESIPECILILNPLLPKDIKGEVVDRVMREAKKDSIEKGYRGMHAFTYNDENFSKVLVHRYGFVDAGSAFYLGLK